MNDDQVDEKEVLDSIYEDDDNFKPLTNISYCYKFINEDNELKSFMLQINWPEEYPEGVGATIDLDSFFNSHIKDNEKRAMIKLITNQFVDWMGMAMTFNIIEYVREHIDDFQDLILNKTVVEREEKDVVILSKEEKEQVSGTKGMTKGQKRRFYDKFGNIDAADKPRGWNWVDVIKHLNTTGSVQQRH